MKKPRAPRKQTAKAAESAATTETKPRTRAPRKTTRTETETGKAEAGKAVTERAPAEASPADGTTPSAKSGKAAAAPRLVRKPAPVTPRGATPKPREEAKTLESAPLPRAVEDALAKARAALDELTAPVTPVPPASSPKPAASSSGSLVAAPELADSANAGKSAVGIESAAATPAATAPAVEAVPVKAVASVPATPAAAAEPSAIPEDEPPAPHGDELAVSLPPRVIEPAAQDPVLEEEPPAPHGDELLTTVPQVVPERPEAPLVLEEEPPAPQGDALIAPPLAAAAEAETVATSDTPIVVAAPAVVPPVAPEAPAVIVPAPAEEAAATDAGLSILMVASEAVPFAKTGGLADVAAALPVALAQLGHRVTMVIPRYRGVEVSGDPIAALDITIGRDTHHVDVYESVGRHGARVWLVDQPALFDRNGIYGLNGHDHPDNPRRYALLARAAFETALATGFRPDIVHAHDWQGGLAPVYLKTRYANDPVLGGVPSVFTIHNIAYTGLADPGWLPSLDLDWELYRTDGGLEYWHKASFLKAGINFSEKVTTVSPGYARELLTPEFAFGFEGVLARRRQDLVGILNGIDAETWDPAHDPHIPAPYTADDLSGKRLAKRALLKAYGLPYDEAALAAPLIGMVSRMVDQKGLDMIAQSASDLPHLGARFVVLGTGEPRYEEMWRALAAYYPDRIAVNVGFDEPLSHLVEAGSDLFLMPSRFEPCGLNQMYSLRYGTLPFVRATGGLDDTVDNYHPETGGGNGFKFWEPSGPALVNTLRWALTVYQNKEVWGRLQRAAMAADFSWARSAQRYVTLYEDVLRTAGRLAATRARDRQASRGRLIR